MQAIASHRLNRARKLPGKLMPTEKALPIVVPICPFLWVSISILGIFDVVELRQGKRSKDATIERRCRELPTWAIEQWATEHLDPEKNMFIIESTSNTHDRALTDHVRAVNELKSFLTTRNFRPENRNLHLDKNREWVESKLEDSSLNQQTILKSLFASLHTAKANRDLFYHVICKEMLAEPQMLSCLRVIGIGMINAFAIVALVGAA